MSEKNLSLDAETEATPLERIGLVCARAAFVATLVGVIEGVVVSNLAETPVSGIGLATAGLWLPGALLALVPATLLRRLDDPRTRRIVAYLFGVGIVVASAFARFAVGAPFPLRAGPLEAVTAIALAWAATELRLEPPLRRPVAIAGLVLAVALQVYAMRWVEGHLAFAGLLSEKTCFPRMMLRTVLRRFV
jgi:hypothetical protein